MSALPPIGTTAVRSRPNLAMPSSMTAVCAAANESSTIAAIKKGKASKRRCGALDSCADVPPRLLPSPPAETTSG